MRGVLGAAATPSPSSEVACTAPLADRGLPRDIIFALLSEVGRRSGLPLAPLLAPLLVRRLALLPLPLRLRCELLRFLPGFETP
jgi:hypothetical protein